MYIKEDSKSSRDSKVRNSKVGVLSLSSVDGVKNKAIKMINKLSKTMSGSGGNRIEAVKQLSKQGGMGAAVPGLQGMPSFMTKGSSSMASPKDKFKKRKK